MCTLFPNIFSPDLNSFDSPEVLLDVAKGAVKQSRSCPWTVHINTLNVT